MYDMTDREKLQHENASAKETVELAQALENLRNNRDFKKLIMNHFCKEEVIRLSTLSADLTLDEEQRQDTLDQIQHHGYLSVWFSVLERKASIAKNSLEESQAHLDALVGDNYEEGDSPYVGTEG